jgi:uncharacterized protein YndB with AHSA1/START domain
VEIARPARAVWDLVCDPSKDPRWCRKVKDVRQGGQRRWTVLHKPVPLRPPMELALEHVELDPPRRLVLREEDDVSVFRVEYRLEPTATGTRFTQVSEFDWKRLPRLLHGLFAHGVRRDVRGQLRALKRELE